MLLLSKEIDDFDQKGTLRVLLMLSEKDHKVTDLLEIKGLGQGGLYTVLRNLMELKLIEEYRDRFNARFFKLNDKGREIAEKIKEIQELLEE